MTAIPKRLATAILSDSVGVIYTAPDDSTARVMGANIVNNAAVAVTYSLWSPEGGSPSDANRLSHEVSIGGNSRADVSELLRQDIEGGWSVYGQADVAGVLTLTMSGTVFTE